MDRLDDIISPDTYKKLTDKFEEQKQKKQNEIDELKLTVEEYKEKNSVEDLLETQKNSKKNILKTRKKSTKRINS
ncbi:MAG: hypothetical protein L6V91_08220 [Bacilli bacterium]|nr:MAG: hypothetical protein L6V91_08220 [Bacilli bacterium]